MERHEDDDVNQEEIEGYQGLMVFDGARLTNLRIRDVELMEEEESGLLKKCLHKSWRII
jgi:hypothetical protein